MKTLLARIGDRLNPILVKEVRQALRGRYFRVSYALALAGALITSILILMSDLGGGSDDEIGPLLAVGIYGCLLATAIAFVPFSAFMSMGSEWDEGTYDLLVLSNLTPRRIVYGKLGSALVQALVFFSAFTPFFVFAFLLRGVNFPCLMLLLTLALVGSPCASLVALGVSSVTSHRFVRIVLMVLLSAGLVALTVMGIAFSGFALAVDIFRPSLGQLAAGMASVASVAIALGVVAGETACARLAHPEENRSTGLRVTVLGAVAMALLWAALVLSESPEPEVLSITAIFVTFLLVLPCAFFASEQERLGRRVALHVPRSRFGALLAAPFLPGGGRGMLFFVLSLAVLLSGIVLLHGAFIGLPLSRASLANWADSGMVSAGLAAAYAMLYVGLPTLVFARACRSPRGRAATRASVPMLAFVTTIFPSVLLFFESGARGSVFGHWLNPAWMIDEAWDGKLGGIGESLGFLALVALLLGNVPRMGRGVAEVLAASAKRRASAREPAADAGGASGDAATAA